MLKILIIGSSQVIKDTFKKKYKSFDIKFVKFRELWKKRNISKFTEHVLNSSGLVIIVPEYNGSMPGALKLFIDLLPYPDSFEERPVCYVGIASGQFAGLRPVEHLQQVFGYRNAYNFPRRVFVPSVHQVASAENGVTDEGLKARLTDQAEKFLNFCRSLGKEV